MSVVGIIVTTTGLTYAAPSRVSTASNLADLTIDKAYVTAGIKSNGSNEFLSMVWTTKNLGPASAGPEITYSHVTGMHVLGTSCIWRGVAGGGDGDFCETSFGRPNASAGTYVVYGQDWPNRWRSHQRHGLRHRSRRRRRRPEPGQRLQDAQRQPLAAG